MSNKPVSVNTSLIYLPSEKQRDELGFKWEPRAAGMPMNFDITFS